MLLLWTFCKGIFEDSAGLVVALSELRHQRVEDLCALHLQPALKISLFSVDYLWTTPHFHGKLIHSLTSNSSRTSPWLPKQDIDKRCKEHIQQLSCQSAVSSIDFLSSGFIGFYAAKVMQKPSSSYVLLKDTQTGQDILNKSD